MSAPRPMTGTARGVSWTERHQARTVAFNVAARWITIAIELALGLVMLPFNTRHLGADDYGLWMLAASIVAYFPVLDLGYASAMDRFVAHYRSQRNARAISEIASTLFFIFAAIGLAAFALVSLVAFHVDTLFNLSPHQGHTGRLLVLLVGAHFSLGLPFAVFGGVVNGFQRTYLNAVVSTVVAGAVAAVNVAVLLGGGSLVTLVAAMTATRLLGFLWYRLNAYRVFPLLRIRPSLFRNDRLREVTGFSVYMLLQRAANKVHYATDPMVIAAFLSTGAVAVWTVAQRLADMVLRLTNQINEVLFPVVVDCDSTQRDDRLRDLLVQGTRLSLGLVLPVAGALALLADQVVIGWTGPTFRDASVILQVMVAAVLVRVATATSGTVLRGGGHHRLLAYSNLVAAAVNLVLSLVLVRTHGLPGVAVATLIPIALRGGGVLIPVACARVGVTARTFLSQAVWPALWPAAVALGLLALVRDRVPPSLGPAVLMGALFGGLYLVLFGTVAIGRVDRRRYITKLRSVATVRGTLPEGSANTA